MRGIGLVGAPSPIQEIGAANAVSAVRHLIVASVGGTVSGAQTLTAPAAGFYRLALFGPGGGGALVSGGGQVLAGGGGSGGLSVSKATFLNAGQAINVDLGAAPPLVGVFGGTNQGLSGLGPSTATLPDGQMLIAGPGGGGDGKTGTPNVAVGGLGGTASGGEFNIPGLAGGSAVGTGLSDGYSGNLCATETVVVNGVPISVALARALGTSSSGYGAEGGGASRPTGGFVGSETGTPGSGYIARNIGTGSGGAIGTGMAPKPVGAHGGAYLILEL